MEYNSGDVWYKAIVPSSGKLNINIKNDYMYEASIVLYSTSTCSLPAPFYCENFIEEFTNQVQLTRTPGESIYIRLSFFMGYDFSITAYDPEATYDEPCDPYIVTIPGKVYSDNTFATGSSGVPEPFCGGYGGDDVWFKTTVPANESMILEGEQYPGSEFTNGAMAVYKGTCGSLTKVECDDNDGKGYMPKIIFTNRMDLAEKVIYIRCWNFINMGQGRFYLILSENVGTDPIFKSTEEEDNVFFFIEKLV